MTKGLPTRATPADNLAGQSEMQSVALQGPGVSRPAPIVVQRSAMTDVTDQLVKWGSERLAKESTKVNEAAYLEGQMAYQQGEAMENIKMGGNKWALEGYRVMDSQTISSSLLAAQQEEISQSGYALSPEDFRANYKARVDGLLEGKDPRTQKLVREQMLTQLPTLVGAHTKSHMEYKEKKNFESLERTIDVVSRDPTAVGQLVSFAKGGEGTASSGLSAERRQAAVVSGVTRAFANDNPLAYAALAGAGLLDEMSEKDVNAIRGAQAAFENRRRGEYNDALIQGERAIMDAVELGQDPSAAAEELSMLYAEHDITMNMADAGAVYSTAHTTKRADNRANASLYDEASLRGDWQTTAKITESIMVHFESGGRADAVSPAGARGTHQVMDGTNSDPGFGVRPAQDNSAEERARVGSDYWAMLHKRYSGDLEAVAIGYNAGPGNADKWLAGGRDYSVLPKRSETEPYAKNIMAALGNWKAPTGADRANIAQQRLNNTRERMAMETFEAMQPELSNLDSIFERGEIDRDEWKQRREDKYQEYGVARQQADVTHEIGVAEGVETALLAKRDKLAEDGAADDRINAMTNAQADLFTQRAQYNDVVNNPASGPGEVAAATGQLRVARQETFDKYDIAVADRGNTAAEEKMFTQMQTSLERNRTWREQEAEIAAATAGGYVSELPKDLQARAFKGAQDRIVNEHSENEAAGRYTEGQGNALIAEDVSAFYAKTGMVDPKVARHMSAAMRGTVIDKDGNPNPAIVDVVEQYAQLKAMNPRAADTMLDEAGRVLAEGILTRSSDGGAIAEGVRLVGVDLLGNKRVEDVDDFMARPEVIKRIDMVSRAFVNDRMSDDITFTSSNLGDKSAADRMALQSPDVLDVVSNEVSVELEKMQRISPNMRPDDMVDAAFAKVERRTEVIGGQVLHMGIDVRKAMFGDKANDFKHPGDVNSAVMDYLRTDAMRARHPFLNETVGTEYMPEWLQSTAGAILAAPTLLFGPDLGAGWTPSMGLKAALDVSATGVRPFDVYPAADGKSVVVQVSLPNGGTSEPITISLKDAGDAALKKHRQRLTK
ncbi:Soluble lytic murein transglycosylase [Pseudorhodobacter antarcticus]|uniref:Soluble lytic murein transglycosylase n=1 Tax=Pseudorhodobacter antarcticus TaxID=1077947 RepID=A0A1H8IHT9_9RHOB|nr:lytic transglycosylase domain-containing protein [Pseudorhodobacter antarcticus]SEN67835.1 Soluble lytic murein transglycosylase [Pseudorhodobacter antarcticus]